MSDILRRGLAPVSDKAWEEIDQQAKRIFREYLTTRAVIELNGPHGWEYGAVNLGLLDTRSEELIPGVGWGLRENLSLTEIRIPFSLNIFELDNVTRGSKTPNLEPVVEATQKAALFEETAVYKGFSAAGIKGILEEATNSPVSMSTDPEEFMKAIEAGVHSIRSHGIGGPYELILGDKPYRQLSAGDTKGYPLHRRAREILGGGVHWSRAISGGLIISSRGGDFELTCGQDFSIGCDGTSDKEVNLYVAESFTFRVLEPAAAVALT
jgi:uncharacterized linocin/CFP29 family protein